jgi:hypothetical protein
MSVITGLQDTLSRLKIGTGSDHTISFGSNYGLAVGSGHTMVLSFPDFSLAGIVIDDIDLTDPSNVQRTLGPSPLSGVWGVVIGANTITFTVPSGGTGGYAAVSQIVIRIGTNAVSGGTGTHKITNPSLVGSYFETITLNNTAPGEEGTVSIPIVDSDLVDVTGYITAYMYFDIDTNTDNSDCGYADCKVHGNPLALPGSNYTVDLGELTSVNVNRSGDSVKHSDGRQGVINSIYFDLSTNAPSGAVVSIKSANGGLKGPDPNLISSVASGNPIIMNDGKYGVRFPTTGAGWNETKHGTLVSNILCSNGINYCGPTTTATSIFDTNSLPVDAGRIRLDIGAAAAYTNNPGTYTDTLTFIATSTF